MTSATFEQALEALGGQLGLIPGLKVYDSLYVPETPSVVVVPPEIDYLLAMGRGAFQVDVDVLLFVSAADAMKVKDLYPYMAPTGTRSIMAIVDDNRSLGFDNVDVHVARARPTGLDEVAAYQAYGAIFTTPLILSKAS